MKLLVYNEPGPYYDECWGGYEEIEVDVPFMNDEFLSLKMFEYSYYVEAMTPGQSFGKCGLYRFPHLKRITFKEMFTSQGD
ncbi:MAG: hypothetical protein HRT57_06830 [Crocinitomicaceae bacterium]|nr:hypothetical protein [Crocinitomicaceae bacterium]